MEDLRSWLEPQRVQIVPHYILISPAPLRSVLADTDRKLYSVTATRIFARRNVSIVTLSKVTKFVTFNKVN